MNPLRVAADFYGPYESLRWDIPGGLTAVLGQNAAGEGISSNGAGKTKLLELLPIALFGPRLPWSEYFTLGVIGETTMVELEFEHRDDLYRVCRTYNPAGRGKTTLDLSVQRLAVPRSGGERSGEPSQGDSSWEALTRESQASTQAAIEALLGMSEATFSQSVFAAQDAQHFADPALTAAARKEILSEAIGLDLWGRLATLVAEDRRGNDQALERLEIELGVLPAPEELDAAEQQVAGNHAAAAACEQEIASLEHQLAEHRRQSDALQAAAAERQAVIGARDLAKAEFARLHEVAEQARQAREQADTLLPQIQEESELAATVPELEAKLDAARAGTLAQTERQSLLAKAQEAATAARGFSLQAARVEAQVKDAEATLEATCDRCGQKTAGAARETMLNSMRQDLLTLQSEQERMAGESETLVAQADAVTVPEGPSQDDCQMLLRAARQAEQTLATLEARYEATAAALARVGEQSFIEAYEAARDALVKAEDALRALPEPEVLTEPSGPLEAELRLKRDQHTMLVATRGASEERLRALRQQVAAGAEGRAELERLKTRRDELALMERCYGRDGVPALLLESIAVPQIEAEAVRVLEQLGTSLRVELRTQRALKTADRQRETLDVVVVEPHGERSYASLSGGEKSRVNLALRIGLARLVAGRKGTDLRVLALDEPEFLDKEGLRRLPEVLRQLTEFDRVLVISHDDALIDGFDQQVLVVKDGDRSRIAA